MNIVGITGQAGSGKDTVADRFVEEHGYVKIALADPLKRLGREVFGFTDTQLWGPSEHRNAHDKRYDHYCRVRVGGKFNSTTQLNKIAHECDPGWFAAAKALQVYAEEWCESVLPEADPQTLFDWFVAMGSLYPRLSPRIMLQSLGTEWGRQVADEDIWVNCMIRTAKCVLDGEQYDRRVGLVGRDPRQPKPRGVVVSDVRFQNELRVIPANGGRLIRVRRPDTDKDAQVIGIKSHASEMEQKSFKDKNFDVVIQNTGTLDDLYEKVDEIAKGWA